MRVVIPQIAWHNRDPILTLDFDPRGRTEEGYYRLCTGGADKLLLIWRLTNPDSIKPEIHCVSELTRHQKGLNVCRFSPCGTYIAAGDDDSYVFIWKNESVSEKEEVWNVEKIFRRHVEDVTDLCWSADSNYLVSGSVDNTSVLWDVKKGTPLHFWSEREHTGFVQGVAYDPLGEFCATMCIDRHLRFFNNKTGKILQKALKYPPAWLGGLTEEEDAKGKENKPVEKATEILESEKIDNKSEVNPDQTSDAAKIESVDEKDKPLSEVNNGDEQELKPPPKKPMTTLNRLFHDDTLKTFCRRLSFSPRGEFLIVPGGLLPPVEKKKEESRQGTPAGDDDENSKDSSSKDSKPSRKVEPDQNNAAIIFCRNSWTNPCAVIPTGTSYSIGARFNPIHYQRERKPYKYDSEFVNSTKKGERMTSCVGKLRKPGKDEGILLNMQYRLVYAVATNDSILIGDTASTEPLACIKNIHCARITDITWSYDGRVLVATSTDGYCSIITFDKSELGEEFKLPEGETAFPALTPTSFPIAPPEPKPVKEPKEPKPKEVKEPKEKKVKEPKEKKEKPPKEKKVKDPVTPKPDVAEKKKPLTVKKMFEKQSPAVGLGKSPKVQDGQLKSTTPSSGTESKAISSTPPVASAPATPKVTFMDSWVKKTPVSSTSDKKQPRRIQLTTLSSKSASNSGLTVGTAKADSSAKDKVASPAANAVTANNSQSNSPKPESGVKKPRRIELVTLNKGDEMPRKVEVVNLKKDNDKDEGKKARRVELITLDDDDDEKEEPERKRRATDENRVMISSQSPVADLNASSPVTKLNPVPVVAAGTTSKE